MGNILDNADITMFDLILQADVVIKLIVMILILASVWSWSVIFEKGIKFKILNFKQKKFERFFWSGQTLEHLYTQIKNFPTHPSAKVFVAAMNEWESSNVPKLLKEKSDLKHSLKERLENIMFTTLSKSTENLKSGLTFLGIVASTATFFGLFGTVWGIMNSFQSIAATSEASLVVVAPGVAGALLTTVIGLFTAIPAVIAYNVYNSQINRFSDRVENLIYELLTMLSRELDR